jgi:hypothetical protein
MMSVIGRSIYGLSLLAVGRTRGFSYFETDTSAYMASLAPWLALAFVSSGLHALVAPHVAADIFLLYLCVLLGPPVIAHFLSTRWGRQDRWALYANILNWVPLSTFVVFTALSAVTAASIQAGAPADAIAELALIVFFFYSLWLQWFVARGALAVSRGRAALLVGLICLFAFALAVIITLSTHLGPIFQMKFK